MAQAATAAAGGGAPAGSSAERKRVKVYELKNNDWYDRGTGFCSGLMIQPPQASPENLDAAIIVVSEEEPSRKLLETHITKDDGYQKQQETLIVWTEATGIDMALSFQEADGCAAIWEFVSDVQGRLAAMAPDDGLSDDLLDPVHSLVLPEPALGRLDEVESTIRAAASTPAGRDALAKFVMHPDQMYILKLTPLVENAEDLESVTDLHKLCTIMKHLILLNDTAIIEFVVTDKPMEGVVGALEYDPDFPSHRANHRQYLRDSSKFKEVVEIKDQEIRNKIHWTYRLLYLKDVVLARILDDPTFSVLNSLIFFHQVDIVNHLQSNQEFLQDLFAIFAPNERDLGRKKEAVLFIQNCCAVSKNIQAQSRAQLYHHFISHGLFTVITFALRHHDAAVRVAGTDILVALIDHDPHMVRNHIYAALREKQTPLTDTLIELLLVEVDLGVKSQMADAIKILLDPSSNAAGVEMMNRAGNAEMLAKQRAAGGAAMQHQNHQNPQTLQFIETFYETSAKKLFAPLKALELRPTLSNLTVQETSLFTHLVEVLSFFVRQHPQRSKGFILGEHLHSRIAQLLGAPQKYMKLAALKWFRVCIGLQDEFHNRQIIQYELFDPILRIVEDTMPRDNLLNSACLELFEYIKREAVKQLILHLIERYQDRLLAISYVNTFQALVMRYEQFANNEDERSFVTDPHGITPQRQVNGRQAFSGLKDMDDDEQAYFEGEEGVDDDDDDDNLPTAVRQAIVNGASPVRPLVSYPADDDEDDDDEMAMDLLAEQETAHIDSDGPALHVDSGIGNSDEQMEGVDSSPTDPAHDQTHTPAPLDGSPPESLAVKRRRDDEEDDDELGKMMGGVKRRNSSTGSLASAAASAAASPRNSLGLDGTTSPGNATPPTRSQQPAAAAAAQPQNHVSQTPSLRRKGSLKTRNESAATAAKFSVKPVSSVPSNAPSVAASQSRHNHQADSPHEGEEDASAGAERETGPGEGGESIPPNTSSTRRLPPEEKAGNG